MDRPDQGSEVRTRLPAGGSRIRTLGPGTRARDEPLRPSFRLSTTLEDGPVHRELPAMVAASYTFGVDQPELQGRATMRTMQFHQTNGAAQVAKHHQFLAEDLDPMSQVLQFVGKADRLPKTAQIFPPCCVPRPITQISPFS